MTRSPFGLQPANPAALPCSATDDGGDVPPAAIAHARSRAAALSERVWPADIPCPAPANSPRLLRELKLRLGRYLDTPQAWLPALNAANGSRAAA